MTAITLRNIPGELRDAIERRAKQVGLSLNKTVLRMLDELLGPARSQPVRYHDLDHLAGTWSAEDGQDFDQALAELRGSGSGATSTS